MKMRVAFLAMAICLALTVVAGAAEAPAPVAEKLMKKAQNPKGFKPLFKEDLSNAIIRKDGWAFEDGVLTAKGKGDIWSEEKYGDFVLDLEFKCAEDTNSGIFIRTGSVRAWLHTSIEVQVLQPNDKYDNTRHHCGGIFDCLGPCKLAVKKAGEWNRCIVIAKANMIHVILNGTLVTTMDLDKWTEAHKNPDGTENKFKNAYKDMPRKGHFGLQYHGHPIWFRNIKVKKL